MVNYQNGKIYKMVSHQTDKMYIGSTTKERLSTRMSEHRRAMKRFLKGDKTSCTSFEILKYDDAKIILLESYPCNSKDELCARERYFMDINKDFIVNKSTPLTNEERHNYYQNYQQSEKYKQYKKEYVKKNKEAFAKRSKEYLQRKKQKLESSV